MDKKSTSSATSQRAAFSSPATPTRSKQPAPPAVDVTTTPTKPQVEASSSSWLGSISPFRSKKPAAEAPSKIDHDTFRYTFSPGRGPFNEPIEAYGRSLNNRYDVGRVKISDITRWSQENESFPEGATEETDPLKKLWRELKGYQVALGDSRDLPGYLHTERGILSGPHGVGMRAYSLGESFMTRSNFNALNDEGRVSGELSERDENSLRITSRATISDIFYSPLIVNKLSTHDSKYDAFLNPEKDGVLSLANEFLNAKLKVEFSHRYIVADARHRPDVYDWRRRLDSFILGQNIDKVETLNLVTLAEAYSQSILNVSTPVVDRMTENSQSTGGSLETVSLMGASSVDVRPSRFSSVFSKKELPSYTDEDPEFQSFANMESWKEALVLDLALCAREYGGLTNHEDTGALVFESSTIILPFGVAQYANKTLQNILADLFLRRARLTFIDACLKDETARLWTAEENKIGLCETLLNDLEHPLVASEENDSYIDVIKNMRDREREFDYGILKGVVAHLFRQANQKAKQLRHYCSNLQIESPKAIWSVAKKLLHETGFVSQLRVLAGHMHYGALADFATMCDTHLVSKIYNRKAFKDFLTNSDEQKCCPIIEAGIEEIIKISRKNTKIPYRKDFLAKITDSELVASEDFDPFLMHTIHKILEPRQELIRLFKQVEELNFYYTLLESCDLRWSQQLNDELVSAIEKLKLIEYDDAGFRDRIRGLILDLSDQYQEILRHALYRTKSHSSSLLVDEYIEALDDKLGDKPMNANLSTEEIFVDRYYRALLRPHGFAYFDHALDKHIEKILSGSGGGLNSDKYREALFFKHFYVGILLGDYLRDNPQEENYRYFLYNRFSTETNGWVQAHFSDMPNWLEARKAVIDVSSSLSHLIQNQRTSEIYINELNAALKKLALYFQDPSWVFFIKLCAWIAALANRYSFSPEQAKEQTDYIYSKIENILKHGEAYFTPRLLQTVRDIWREYRELNDISQKAVAEWLNERTLSLDAVAELYRRGEDLFRTSSSTTQSNVFRQALWLNLALQFHYGIKDSFQGRNRISLVVTQEDLDLIAQNQSSAADLATTAQQRRMYIVKIFGMILSNPNLSPLQRKAVRQCTQDIFKNQEIRGLTLENILEKLKKEPDQVQRNYLIETQIPGFVFSGPECEILADQDFTETVKRRLSLLEDADDALQVDKFFEQILAGLGCIGELTRDARYHVFIPCLMERVFAAFSVIYRYITTKSAFVTNHMVTVWVTCISIIREIADAVHVITDTSGRETHNGQQCRLFAGAWEEIRRRVFPHSLRELQSEFIRLQQKPNLYDLVLAYDVCLDLNEAGFNTGSAIDIISQHWYDVTKYEITANAIKALRFILEPQEEHAPRKLTEKLEMLCEFFTHAVTEVRQLGNVLCIQVSNNYLLSSYASSQMLPVRIKENGQLDSENFSLRRAESLDQITIDVAKIMSTRMAGNYSFVFFYRPSLKTLMNYSSERCVVRCVEVYRKDGEIVRQDCFVSDERDQYRMSESSWASFAARMLPVAEQNATMLARNISYNSSVNDDVLVRVRIFPEFFNLVLQLIQSSMQFIERMHEPSLTPISAAFLKPASADYYDPRALLHCGGANEDALIGLFVLGLIYEEIKRQEAKMPTVADGWLCNLPRFFADSNSGRSNVKSLAKVGIVNGTILQPRYGSSGKDDPIEKALRALDTKLERLRPIRENRQSAYCNWFKDTCSQEAENVSDGTLTSTSGSTESMPDSFGL